MPPSSRSSDVSLRLYCEHIVEVDIKAERALTETKILQAREALEHARVVKLEAEVERLKAQLSAISVSDGAGFKREKFDPALQRVRFVGWPAAKRAAIEAFLSQHSPNTPVVYIGCVIVRFDWKQPRRCPKHIKPTHINLILLE